MAPHSHVKAAAPKVKGSFTMRAVNQAPVASGSGSSARGSNSAGVKRKQPARDLPSDDDDEEEDGDIADAEEDGSQAEGETDTDDEIAAAQQAGKSKKTAKRKRRATSPTTFGEALSGLLGRAAEGDEEDDDVEAGEENKVNKVAKATQQPAILSLAPHIRRGAQSSRLNAKAARIALDARRKREDRAHVIDVIGAWGAPGEAPKTLSGEARDETETRDISKSSREWEAQGGAQGYEKRLRKAAQRGVVKLFNAIRAAQNTTQEDLEEPSAAPVKAKEQAPAAAAAPRTTTSLKKGDNALGGKARAVSELSKNNFFDLIRAGTTGQRA